MEDGPIFCGLLRISKLYIPCSFSYRYFWNLAPKFIDQLHPILGQNLKYVSSKKYGMYTIKRKKIGNNNFKETFPNSIGCVGTWIQMRRRKEKKKYQFHWYSYPSHIHSYAYSYHYCLFPSIMCLNVFKSASFWNFIFMRYLF